MKNQSAFIALPMLFGTLISCSSKEEDCLTVEQCQLMQQGIPVDLPSAQPSPEMDNSIDCFVNADGNYFIEGAEDSVAFAELAEELSATLALQGSDAVKLEVDPATRFSFVLQAMNLCKDNEWKISLKID